MECIYRWRVPFAKQSHRLMMHTAGKTRFESKSPWMTPLLAVKNLALADYTAMESMYEFLGCCTEPNLCYFRAAYYAISSYHLPEDSCSLDSDQNPPSHHAAASCPMLFIIRDRNLCLLNSTIQNNTIPYRV